MDRALREQLQTELLQLQQSLRLPMLLITHDDADVARLGEQVVHLAGGRVAEARDLRRAHDAGTALTDHPDHPARPARVA